SNRHVEAAYDSKIHEWLWLLLALRAGVCNPQKPSCTLAISSSLSNKQPIFEDETAFFFKEIKVEEDGSEEDNNVKLDFTVTIKSDLNDRISSQSSQDMGLTNLHAASMPELVEQLQEVREEKKRIRKTGLKDFEDNFFQQNGRNVQKKDRAPTAEEYNEYKQVKAELRLLEVLCFMQ
uniref:FAM13A-like domain-containing protein n=1 Tax=Salvator merianae TaxID=96440 RepID=A0A8D0DFY9_SALMN